MADKKPKLTYVNTSQDKHGYFIGYKKGKHYREQKERYKTQLEAMNALVGLPLNTAHKFLTKKGEVNLTVVEPLSGLKKHV